MCVYVLHCYKWYAYYSIWIEYFIASLMRCSSFIMYYHYYIEDLKIFIKKWLIDDNNDINF